MKISEKLAIAVEALEEIIENNSLCVSSAGDAGWIAFLAMQKIRGYVLNKHPTVEEVAAYIEERKALGKTGVDAEKWHAHYSANGWMVGRNKMKDWKAAVRTWEKEAPKYKPISRRLEPDDCVDAVAFDLWWQQQEVISRNEMNRIKAHAIRIGNPDFEVVRSQLQRLKTETEGGVGLHIPHADEEQAAIAVRELQQRQPVRAARVISRD